MLRARMARVTAALMAFALLAAACSARDDDANASTGGEGGGSASAESGIDTANCVSDPTTPIEGDTIKLVSSFPQSGQTAAFSQIAKGWKSYIQMVNDAGGVKIGDKTFTIETSDKDDQYNAAVTSANIDELAGADGENGFAVF